jgi:hypothetical protein
VKQGPLSVVGLERILTPSINKTNLRAALVRLHKKGLLKRRFDNAYGTVYHYLSDDPKIMNVISRLFECPAEGLRNPCFRHAELLHSQECAIWFYKLQRLFPQAKVLREHEFSSDPLASSALLSEKLGATKRPDLMILFPSVTAQKFVKVGVEIERFLKSKKRLVQKLDQYASRSILDGVIYVCASDTIESALRTVYRSRVIERALRVNHYGSNFLLFTQLQPVTTEEEPVMRNAALQTVNLSSWLHHLSQTEHSRRRDKNSPSTVPPHR